MRRPTPSITSESDRTALEPVPQSVLVLQPAIRSRSRNPQSAIHSQPLSHSWGPGKKTVFPRAAISSLSARLGASLLTVHCPPARVSVGHVLSFARSYPPTLPKQASIPSFHPPPIHPFIPSRPRLPPKGPFLPPPPFRCQHNHLRPIDDHEPTRRQDERFSLASRAASTTTSTDRPSQSPPSPRTIHLAPPDDCATDLELRSTHRTTTSSTTTSPTPAPAVERRISPSARLDRHHDGSLSVVGPLCAVVAPCLVNIPSRFGCSTMIELRQPSAVDTSPSTVSPVPSR